MFRDPPSKPAPIKVRVSTRAKRACLKVSAVGTVEVVVPKGFNHSLVTEFVAQHRNWLDKTLARMKLNRDPALDTYRPRRIQLQAINETWWVNYGLRKKAGVSEYRKPGSENQLWIWTPQELSQATPFSQPLSEHYSQTHFQPLLQQWLSSKAKLVLKPWLRRVSEETGLGYGKLCVRAQKTRWGSCSSEKHINLNRALMFLPEELVRYLMIHELSHTVHLNHSRAFWSLVGRWEPQYKKYESLLNQYSLQIPLWALP